MYESEESDEICESHPLRIVTKTHFDNDDIDDIDDISPQPIVICDKITPPQSQSPQPIPYGFN